MLLGTFLSLKSTGGCYMHLFRTMATVRKRFYKSVTVTQSNGVFEINLDNHKLKTPGGKVLQIPSRALAAAVAVEWESQESVLRQSSMHLTSLCNTSIDNPLRKTKESLSELIVAYLDTDTLCYRQDQPEELLHLQKKEWDPIVSWINERYAVNLQCTTDITVPTIEDSVRETFQRHLLSYNFSSLLGFEFAVDTVKSVLLTLAVADRRLSVEDAVKLSRLEQEYQINFWGRVEWHHDLEMMDTQARLAAATLFIHATSQSDVVQQRPAQA